MPKGYKGCLDDTRRIAEKYNLQLLSSEFIHANSYYDFTCNICRKLWRTRIHKIRTYKGCPYCSGIYVTIESLRKLADSRGFTLISKKYKTMKTKYEWQCPEGHKWFGQACNIQQGRGCPYCKIFITEEKCRFILQQLTGRSFPKTRQDLVDRMELDGYCAELNLAFEYQGEQHFIRMNHIPYKSFHGTKKRDKLKLALCKEKGIDLIVITYTERFSLESYLADQLVQRALCVNNRVDWSVFPPKRSKLESMKALLLCRNIKCLATHYEGMSSKVDCVCTVCQHEWQSTLTRLVTMGTGCWYCTHCVSRRSQTSDTRLAIGIDQPLVNDR